MVAGREGLPGGTGDLGGTGYSGFSGNPGYSGGSGLTGFPGCFGVGRGVSGRQRVSRRRLLSWLRATRWLAFGKRYWARSLFFHFPSFCLPLLAIAKSRNVIFFASNVIFLPVRASAIRNRLSANSLRGIMSLSAVRKRCRVSNVTEPPFLGL